MGYGQFRDYGYDPENAPEPTEADYCAMDGHDTVAYRDYSQGGSGYDYCHCGEYASAPYGEPHDEYSAACANVIDSYVKELLARTPSYANDDSRYRRIRLRVGLTLRNQPLDYLLALHQSLSNSTPRCFNTEEPNIEQDELSLFVALGVHVSNSGMDILHAALTELRGETESARNIANLWRLQRQSLFDTLTASDTIQEARSIAKLISLLEPEKDRHNAAETLNAVVKVSPYFVKRPESLPIVAAVFNNQGFTKVATELIIETLSQEEIPPAVLMDGAL